MSFLVSLLFLYGADTSFNNIDIIVLEKLFCTFGNKSLLYFTNNNDAELIANLKFEINNYSCLSFLK